MRRHALPYNIGSCGFIQRIKWNIVYDNRGGYCRSHWHNLTHTEDKVTSLSNLVRMIAKRFKGENEHLYYIRDYVKAKQLYIYFMLGTYNPKRKQWEDHYTNERGK